MIAGVDNHNRQRSEREGAMTSALGIKVGTASSVVAVAAPKHHDSATQSFSFPSALYLGEHGPVLDPAALSGSAPQSVIVTDYADRVGDPVAIVAADGSSHSAADLVAATADALVNHAGATGAVAFAYPTMWREYTIDTLREALKGTAAAAAVLVSEAAATVAELGEDSDDAVLVYDLGARGLTVSALRPGTPAQLLGAPCHTTDLGGEEFDGLLLSQLLSSLEGGGELDTTDPAVVEGLAALRAEATRAKEALSLDTEATVAVRLPGMSSELRVVRGDLEALVREPLTNSIEVVQDALRTAGLTTSDITAVVLAGGGASIPLVAEILSTELGLPVRVSSQPALTSARGAATLAAQTEPAPGPAPVTAVSRAAVAAAPTQVITAPALPPVAPVVAAAPWHRRFALSTAAAAAVLVLAAGGLAVGTGWVPGVGSAADVSQDQVTDDGGFPFDLDMPWSDSDDTTPGSTDSTSVRDTGGTGGSSGSAERNNAESGGSESGGSRDGGTVAESKPASPDNPATGGTSGGSTPGGTAPVGSTPGGSAPVASTPQAPDLSGPISNTGNAVGNTVGGVGDALGNTVGTVGDTAGGVTDGLATPAGAATGAVSNLAPATGGLTGGVDNVVGGLSGTLDGVTGIVR